MQIRKTRQCQTAVNDHETALLELPQTINFDFLLVALYSMIVVISYLFIYNNVSHISSDTVQIIYLLYKTPI